jgi:hypothetical protein
MNSNRHHRTLAFGIAKRPLRHLSEACDRQFGQRIVMGEKERALLGAASLDGTRALTDPRTNVPCRLEVVRRPARTLSAHDLLLLLVDSIVAKS